jgi:hypothetical protein
MYTAYLDGSGGGNKDVFVLGGYIASNDAWALLSDEWRTLLEREPRLDSFKMSYMAQTDARMKRAEEFYRIIEKHVAGYVGCVIYTEELLKAESQITWPPNYFNQHVIRNPYFSAFHSTIRQLIEYQHEIGIDKPAVAWFALSSATTANSSINIFSGALAGIRLNASAVSSAMLTLRILQGIGQ